MNYSFSAYLNWGDFFRSLSPSNRICYSQWDIFARTFNTQASGSRQKRSLGNSDEAGYLGDHSHVGSSQRSESLDCVNWKDQPEKIKIFVTTQHRKRIELSLNLQNTVLEVRKLVYNILNIPLNQWRLLSCGGKLLWDSRTLADYSMENQATLSIWLLMKGGGIEAERTRQETPAGPGTTGTLQSDERWTPGSKQRRSERLNLKRPREAREDGVSGSQHCPLCDDEISQNKTKSMEGLIFCCVCGRGFHLECSGVQDGWAGHWKLECRHKGLECSLTTRCSTARVRTKKGGEKVLPSLQKRKRKDVSRANSMIVTKKRVN